MAALMAVALLSAASASFLKLSMEQKIKQADAVLQGRFVSQRMEGIQYAKARVYDFVVDKIYKAPERSKTQISGKITVALTMAIKLPPLPLDKEIVIFVREKEGSPGRYLLVGLDQGLPVISDPSTGQKQIRLTDPSDYTPGPATEAASRKSAKLAAPAGASQENPKTKTLTQDEFRSLVNRIITSNQNK